MGRGRGKGKKQFAIGRDDYVSGEDEKLPMKRRGRPQKPVKDEMASADEVEIIEGEEYEDGDDTKSSEMVKNNQKQDSVEKGKKRKRSKTADLINEENGLGTKTNANALIKSLSFRHIGSRRKNKPRRAAEVGVECK